MKHYFKIAFLLLSAVFIGCDSDDEGTTGDGGGGEPEVIEATYRLTFNANFTPQTHPDDYPAEATFGPLFAMAHGQSNGIFKEGQLASDGFRALIESGDVGTLTLEVTPTDDGSGDNSGVSIATGDTLQPTGSTSFTVTVTPSSTFLSFAARIDPSPDWFVGIDDFNLLGSDNLLIEDETIELFALDAGIDAGTTYTSDPEPNSESISEINGFPFSTSDGGPAVINALGTLRIERID